MTDKPVETTYNPFHGNVQCLRNVQIWRFFWSVFSYIRTESMFSSNTGKYGPEKTPYLDTFDAVDLFLNMVP